MNTPISAITFGTPTIFVLTNGFVLYGVPTAEQHGRLYYRSGAVIRRWGTTAGLGELARLGPREATTLDWHGTGYIANPALLFTIDCHKEWNEG